MNVLLKLLETIPNGKVEVKTVLQKEIYYFKWNQPTKKEQIESFEIRTGYTLPDEYKEFLLQSNGGTIFKTEFEDDGYKLLGIDEIEKMTHEMIKFGYEISNEYFCFIQCLYSDDVLFLDLNRLNSIVVDFVSSSHYAIL
ncbi:MAG: SMI1/KNR4 family protein [Prevotella sp.]|nr:SMI1/KNR4 family protein [Alistipes senegalensis]MCM1357860.1 SMI1/KNR4 family protein [Prevotella sp.]